MALEQLREYDFYSRPPRAMRETIGLTAPKVKDVPRFSVGISGIEHLMQRLDEGPLTLGELFQLLADYRESIGAVSQGPQSENGKEEGTSQTFSQPTRT